MTKDSSGGFTNPLQNTSKADVEISEKFCFGKSVRFSVSKNSVATCVRERESCDLCVRERVLQPTIKAFNNVIGNCILNNVILNVVILNIVILNIVTENDVIENTVILNNIVENCTRERKADFMTNMIYTMIFFITNITFYGELRPEYN